MTEKDLYRETPVRYIGYANEIGEAFKSFLPKIGYYGTYGIAISYVLADTADKSKNFTKPWLAADVLIWQMLASVMIPGLAINRTCHFSRKLLMQNSQKFKNFQHREYVISGIGLAAIPLIIKPIDQSVDFLMDKTYRKHVLKID